MSKVVGHERFIDALVEEPVVGQHGSLQTVCANGLYGVDAAFVLRNIVPTIDEIMLPLRKPASSRIARSR